MLRPLILTLSLLLALAFPAMAQRQAAATLAEPTADQQAILAGVGTVQVPENLLPGAVCFFGENAFPILLGQPSANVAAPMAAGAHYEKGRVVIFGHDQLIRSDFFNADDNNRTLCLNLVAWLSRKTATGENKPRDEIRVVVIGELEMIAFLITRGVKADFFRTLTDEAIPDRYDVLIINAERIRSEDVEKIDQFVKNGGGLMTSATGWGWQQLNPNGNLKTTFAGNQLTAPMGLVWTDMTLPRTRGYTPALRASKFLHPQAALDALTGGSELAQNDWAQLVATLELAMGSIPEAQAAKFSKLQDLMTREVIPTRQQPIVAAEQPLDRLAMLMQTQRYMHVQTAQNGLPEGLVVPKLAAAADFPGEVPANAPRVSWTFDLDSGVFGWQNTSLYAAPGEVITVTIPATVAAQQNKFSVRIGAHTDRLWHLPSWQRYPEISLAVTLDKPVTQVVNPFGGNIYIIGPQGTPRVGTGRPSGGTPAVEAPPVLVEIAGAVVAPYYEHGRTTFWAWRQSRQAPGPWAELVSDRLILTVPSHLIRELDNPGEVMEFWNAVLDGHASLAAWERRDQPERIVADRQLSAGWMHAGYPIVIPSPQTDRGLVDLEYLRTRGDRWGFFHELGHNHQAADWTFSGSGEVTVNLFTLYTFVHSYNMSISETRREMRPEVRKAAKEAHIAAGAPFARWQADPFLALTMYVELIEEFGWDALKTVFAEYRDLPANERPRNDNEKRDQWMWRFSKTVGKNLGPFFDQWGVPVSQGAKDLVSDLPVWLPE